MVSVHCNFGHAPAQVVARRHSTNYHAVTVAQRATKNQQSVENTDKMLLYVLRKCVSLCTIVAAAATAANPGPDADMLRKSSSVQQRDFTPTWQQAMFFQSQTYRSGNSGLVSSYDIGRIYKIHETTESVAELVFLASPGIDYHPELKEDCERRLQEIQSRGSLIGKGRPCVIIQHPDGKGRKPSDHLGPKILLLATFGGARHEDIPYVLRHFLHSILPNNHPTDKSSVSTKPTWTNPKQWLLQFPFYSSRRVEGLWTADLSQNDIEFGYQFSEDTMETFKEQCEEIWQLWYDLCATDPAFLPQRIQEFRACLFFVFVLFRRSHISLWTAGLPGRAEGTRLEGKPFSPLLRYSQLILGLFFRLPLSVLAREVLLPALARGVHPLAYLPSLRDRALSWSLSLKTTSLHRRRMT